MTVARESLRATLAEEVTGRLRAAILSGEIAPDQRIRVRDLQERYGISHIPIREALRHLEAEGLVETEPQRGATATSISLDQLAELYDFRRLLEASVAERAVPHFTPERLALIQRSLDELEELASAPQSDEYFAAHRDFHWAILEPGATPLIERTLRQLWQMSERYVRLAVKTSRTDTIARGQHRTLCEACLARDANRLTAEIHLHLQVTADAIRVWYESTRPRLIPVDRA